MRDLEEAKEDSLWLEKKEGMPALKITTRSTRRREGWVGVSSRACAARMKGPLFSLSPHFINIRCLLDARATYAAARLGKCSPLSALTDSVQSSVLRDGGGWEGWRGGVVDQKTTKKKTNINKLLIASHAKLISLGISLAKQCLLRTWGACAH